jgi:hypothetical protein
MNMIRKECLFLFRLIIAGSRDFNDYSLLKQWCDYMLQNFNPADVMIVSGTARGADKLGEQYAMERGMKLDARPAKWDQYGKSAGYLRNEEMAQNADALIAFTNGSKGTGHMINLAHKYNLKVKVVHF